MAQGKVYRNCSSLTTPPAIQGPEVSATWRRTSRGDVLMTVRMPQVPLCSNHGPLDFIHLEEALEQTPHPQQGNQGQTQKICTTEDTQRYQS